MKKNDNLYYLTLCTFSFEIKESSLSDTRCVIQYVVSLHRSYKKMARNFLCRTTLSWRHSIGMRGKPHQCNQRKQSDCL